MMAETIAGAGAFAFGLVCLRAGRGPVAMTIWALLHLQAAGRCVRVCLAAARETWRSRYREIHEQARREAGW